MIDKNFTDEGVSPVIGVILMVAITVILAAVIGTFVLDLAGGTDQTPQAGFEFDEAANTLDDGTDSDTHYDVTVTIISIGTGDEFRAEAPEYTESDNNATAGNDTWADAGSTQSPTFSSVGESVTLDEVDPDDTVTMIGVIDGEDTVVQEYSVKGNV